MLRNYLKPSKLSKTSNQLESIRSTVNNMIEDSMLWPQDLRALYEGTDIIPVDMYEDGNNLVVKATLPGVKPENLDIEVRDNVLTISGEAKEENERKEKDYHLRERSCGRFQRSIYLPEEVKTEKADADFHDGILTLTLPKAEASRRKKILVKSKPAAQN